VQNFAALQGKANSGLDKIRIASIEPVTSSTLRELGWRADIAAKEFTIPWAYQSYSKNSRHAGKLLSAREIWETWGLIGIASLR
jgi:hypothetical protein